MADTTPIHETFRNAREQAHISQAEVARRLSTYGMKVSPSTVTKWESGERGISLDAAMRLCDVLGVNWNDLYSPMGGGDHDQITRILDPLEDRLTYIAGQLDEARMSIEDWPETLDTLDFVRKFGVSKKGEAALHELPGEVRKLDSALWSARLANDEVRMSLSRFRNSHGSA